jgi:uncharacterized protein
VFFLTRIRTLPLALQFLTALGTAVLITALGLRNSYGVNEHLFGVVATAAVRVYCILEEYAWRGYLQEELSGLRPLLR